MVDFCALESEGDGFQRTVAVAARRDAGAAGGDGAFSARGLAGAGEFQWKDREKPRYLLRKGNLGWQLVFDGKETVLGDEKAVAYVGVLMLDPPVEPIHGTELAHRAFGDAVVEEQRNLGMDDAETAREMAETRRRCQAVIDNEGASEVEREEARAELEEIEDWARKHMRGTEGNEQRQVRAIRQSIRRFVERLRTARNVHGEADEVLRAFGEHLDRYLAAVRRRDERENFACAGGAGGTVHLRAASGREVER